MINKKETKCGNYTANKNNPLGLLRQGNEYYQLLGFFNYNDRREYFCDMRGALPFSRLASSFENGFSRHSIYPDDQYSDLLHENMIVQMRHLKLDTTEIIYLYGCFDLCYLFQIHRKPISLKAYIPTTKEQAICDYFHHNKIIPQIMSVNRMAKEMAIYSSGEETTTIQGYQVVDQLLFTQSIDSENSHERLKEKAHQKYITERYSPESIIERQTKEERSEPAFVLNSDYAYFGQELNVDLIDIQKRIQAQANRKGGHTTFNYKNINYKIPLLPLLCWHLSREELQRNNKLTKLKLNNSTWYTVASSDIKTNNDNLFHSDWWIGAGFPIELYQQEYKYKAFNKALTNFVLDIVGKNTLENVTFLAGQGLSSITGKIVKYPSSINDFNEDDIIILPNGSINFDLYIKKACKNKKGAVIVEVGNKVAHLSIVSREYNSRGFEFRLILLPDANKLLLSNSIVEIDPINNIIKPI